MKGGGESSSEKHSRRQEQSSGVHPRLPSSQEDRASLTKSKLKKKKSLKPVYRFNYRERGKVRLKEKKRGKASEAFFFFLKSGER